MPTIFTRIIDGELPGHFVWRDDEVVGFMSINPLQRGHALIVPVLEVDHWVDIDADLNQRLMHVAHVIGQAQMQAFKPERIGLIIAGYEVPHLHVHVIPTFDMGDLSFANAAGHVDADELAAAAADLRAALTAMGHPEVPA